MKEQENRDREVEELFKRREQEKDELKERERKREIKRREEDRQWREERGMNRVRRPSDEWDQTWRGRVQRGGRRQPRESLEGRVRELEEALIQKNERKER